MKSWLCLFFLSCLMNAQSVPGNPIIQGWGEKSIYWVDTSRFDWGINVEFFANGGKKVQKISFPFGDPVSISLNGDKIGMLSKLGANEEFRYFELGNNKRWVMKGRIKSDSGPFRVFPLDQNSYLFASDRDLFVLGDSASPYAVGSIGGDGFFRIERLVNLDLGVPIVQKRQRAQEGGVQWELTRPVGKQFMMGQMLLKKREFIPFASGGGVLLFHWPGYLFLLDEHGGVRKKIVLNPDVDASKLKDLYQIEPVLVGVAQRRDGTLLLATREKEAALQAHKLFPATTRVKDLADIDTTRELRNRQARLDRFPRIVWMELDPAEGRVRRLEQPPSGAPSHFRDDMTPGHFKFLVDSQDEVRIVP